MIRGQRNLGMGGHHQPVQGAKDEWLTPPDIIQALAPFDLDPCAPTTRPWPTAARHLTIEDDGLSADWSGFVWCNPPYGQSTWAWLDRLADHHEGGIALVFARTETAGFMRSVWGKAHGLLFISGRLFFHHVDGRRAAHNSGAPSVLVAYGGDAVDRLEFAHGGSIAGAFVKGWRQPS